jgi:hypothetical protein
MPEHGTSLHRPVLAAIVALALSVPVVSIAQADEPPSQPAPAKMHAKKHAARTQPRHARQSHYVPRHLYGAVQQPWTAERPAWPYQNQFPPYMSTWPAGSPNYHGPRPGPTFPDEQ